MLTSLLQILTPIEAVTDDSVEYNFRLPKSLVPRYTILSECLVSCRISVERFLNNKWEGVTEVDNIAYIDGLSSSLFKLCDITLNDTLIKSANNYSFVSNHLSQLLSYSPVNQKTLGRLSGGYPDANDPDNTMSMFF